MAFHETDIAAEIAEGFERIARVLRADQRRAGEGLGLTPGQQAILAYLAGRDGARLSGIAADLSVTAPTASVAVEALVRRGLVQRERSGADARAVALRLSDEGRRLVARLSEGESAAHAAIGMLAEADQAHLMRSMIRLIRSLQIAGAIPVQRLCVTCRHFRPHIHSDATNPHHCAFVNAAFGDRNLRLDCGEHEPAGPAEEAATFSALETGPAFPPSPT